MKSWKLILVAIFAVTIASQYAFASTITATYQGSAKFGAETGVGYGSGTIWPNPTYPNSPETQVGVGIGGDNFSTLDTGYKFSETGSFDTWCVDITHWMISGNVTYEIGGESKLISVFGLERVSALQKLANVEYSTLNDQTESAAFQLATWAIMFGEKSTNGVYSLNSSSFVAPSTDTGYDLAKGWLESFESADDTGYYKITYLFQSGSSTGTKKTSQDMVVFTDPPPPVPEPATMLLLGLGLIGLGGIRRKFKQ